MVLTAAHCLSKAENVEVRLGSIDRHNMPLTIFGESWVVHGEYDPVSLKNDIALVYLSSAPWGPNIATVDVATGTYEDMDGLITVLPGFGQTATNGPVPAFLKFARVKVINIYDCANTYWVYPDYMLCAQPYDKDVNHQYDNSCYGDSGGGMLAVNRHTLRQTVIGMVSFGSKQWGCNYGMPTVYTRISAYRWWIEYWLKEKNYFLPN